MWKRTCTCSVIQNNTLYSSSSGKSTKNSAHYRGDAFKVLHKIMTLASVTVAVRVCHCVIGLLLWDTSQWMSPLFALAVFFFLRKRHWPEESGAMVMRATHTQHTAHKLHGIFSFDDFDFVYCSRQRHTCPTHTQAKGFFETLYYPPNKALLVIW